LQRKTPLLLKRAIPDLNKLFDADAPPAPSDDVDEGEEVPIDSFQLGNRVEDIAIARHQGFDVDDDNEPAPENVPQANDVAETDTGLYPGQRWGAVHSHVDPMVNDGFKQPPSFRDGFDIKNASLLDILCFSLSLTLVVTLFWTLAFAFLRRFVLSTPEESTLAH
jgi:hypothetical protein